MRPECEQYDGRLRDICEGCADLPPNKINAYRAKWGLGPLRDDEVSYIPPAPRPRIEEVTRTPAAKRPVSNRRVHRHAPQLKGTPGRSGGGCGSCGGRRPQMVKIQTNGRGPGSQLLKIWDGMPHCDACLELAAKMDTWGKEVCAQKLDEVVNDILPRAKTWVRDNRPWIHKILDITSTEQAALRFAISRDVRKAIRLAT